MSRMLIRGPAARFPVVPQQGLSDRQSFGAVDTAKSYGGAQDGGIDPNGPAHFQYVWQDRLQINPAHEQPRLIFYSGAQPLIRWGLMRRYTRTYMRASPRFQGRWGYVGFIQRHYTERARMSGYPQRTGVTYVTPTFSQAPRAIYLGGAKPNA